MCALMLFDCAHLRIDMCCNLICGKYDHINYRIHVRKMTKTLKGLAQAKIIKTFNFLCCAFTS